MNKTIKELRKNMGLSALQLSRILGVSHTSIANWENGLSEPINIMKEKIMRLKRKIEKQQDAK